MSEAGIQRLFGSGQKALVGVSVHISSLTSPSSRARILTTLEGFSRDLLRYRLLKITGVAPGFPRIYLAEIVAALKLRVPNCAVVEMVGRNSDRRCDTRASACDDRAFAACVDALRSAAIRAALPSVRGVCAFRSVPMRRRAASATNTTKEARRKEMLIRVCIW